MLFWPSTQLLPSSKRALSAASEVSGPPGIGKTTACRLVAEMHGGYEVPVREAFGASWEVLRDAAKTWQTKNLRSGGPGPSLQKTVR